MNTSPGARIALPVPPSANVLWRNVRGRMVKSRAYRAYSAAAKARWVAAGGAHFPKPQSVMVKLWWYRARKSGDLDNRIKAALDVLSGIAYTDDSQVVAVYAWRADDCENPRLCVSVEAV